MWGACPRYAPPLRGKQRNIRDHLVSAWSVQMANPSFRDRVVAYNGWPGVLRTAGMALPGA
jgi:hypothetical protein